MAFEHYPQFKAPYGEIQANAINWHFIGFLFRGIYFFDFKNFILLSHKPTSFANILMEKHNKCDYSYSLYGAPTILRDFKKAPFYILCLFHMVDLRVFSLSFFILFHNGP